MNVVFCSVCGMKHTYNFAKPNFCSGCGSPLSVNIAEKTHPNKSLTPKIKAEVYAEEDYDEDSTDSDYVPDIGKLQVEIEASTDANTFTLGSLFGEESSKSSSRKNTQTSLEDFKNYKSRGR